jgi:hypothetical protein
MAGYAHRPRLAADDGLNPPYELLRGARKHNSMLRLRQNDPSGKSAKPVQSLNRK